MKTLGLVWILLVILTALFFAVSCGDDDDGGDSNDDDDDDTGGDDDDDDTDYGNFQTSVVSDDAGQDHVLAVDSTGIAHVAYPDRDSHDFYYANNSTGTWETVITEEGWWVWSFSIAVDSSDVVHAVYRYNSTGGYEVHQLKYVKITSGVPSAPSLLPFEGSDADIVVDGPGNAHVVYICEDKKGKFVMYASNVSGSWEEEEIVESPEGYHSRSIALDNTGKPFVAYNIDDEIIILKKVGGNWVEHCKMGNCEYCSPHLGLDKNNNISVLYSVYDDETDTSDFVFAKYNGGTWEKATIPGGDSHHHSNGSKPYAIDSDGYGHISFPICLEYDDYFCISAQLNYATNRGGSWETYEVDPEGAHTSDIFVDEAGYAHIVYDKYGPLVYATNRP